MTVSPGTSWPLAGFRVLLPGRVTLGRAKFGYKKDVSAIHRRAIHSGYSQCGWESVGRGEGECIPAGYATESLSR
jgi:hypothetical protein